MQGKRTRKTTLHVVINYKKWTGRRHHEKCEAGVVEHSSQTIFHPVITFDENDDGRAEITDQTAEKKNTHKNIKLLGIATSNQPASK